MLTSLNKYLDEGWLRAAFKQTRKDGTSGVDGMSAEEYGMKLDKRLPDLVNRVNSGNYHAPTVRRTYIKKPGKHEKRPLGIPTAESKLLQKAVVMLLEPIYENEFYDFSYGFRPRRSCHQALEAIRDSIMEERASWIREADIRHYWHKWLRRRDRCNNRWNWEWYERTIAANYPLPKPRIVRSVYRRANP